MTSQEPEDDPRNFCYVWTAHSETDLDLNRERLSVSGPPASLSLYALSYEERIDADDVEAAIMSCTDVVLARVLYSKLTSCTLRFEHTLAVGDSYRDKNEVRSQHLVTVIREV